MCAAGKVRQGIRAEIDLVSDKHWPKMLALTPEERQWIVKVHKNMGHPGTQKLRFANKSNVHRILLMQLKI